MPPRITRNSYRPRASDRTMVDLESPFADRSRKSTTPLTHQRTRWEWVQVKLLQRSLMTVGWISRKHLDSGRGTTFFLTSLLIELIEPRVRSVSDNADGTRPPLDDACQIITRKVPRFGNTPRHSMPLPVEKDGAEFGHLTESPVWLLRFDGTLGIVFS